MDNEGYKNSVTATVFVSSDLNSFSATHPDLNELKKKLVETFKVASTDVAWWHRIGESGKPTRSWAACFSDSTT
jgi:hypothetical protein